MRVCNEEVSYKEPILKPSTWEKLLGGAWPLVNRTNYIILICTLPIHFVNSVLVHWWILHLTFTAKNNFHINRIGCLSFWAYKLNIHIFPIIDFAQTWKNISWYCWRKLLKHIKYLIHEITTTVAFSSFLCIGTTTMYSKQLFSTLTILSYFYKWPSHIILL